MTALVRCLGKRSDLPETMHSALLRTLRNYRAEKTELVVAGQLESEPGLPGMTRWVLQEGFGADHHPRETTDWVRRWRHYRGSSPAEFDLDFLRPLPPSVRRHRNARS